MKALVFALLAIMALSDASRPPNHDGPFGVCPPRDEATGEPVYLMDMKQRAVFYECNSGIPIRQHCPGGLFFNPVLKVCDYPSMDCEPCGPVGSCQGVFGPRRFRDGCNISVFYECDNDEAVLHKCAAGFIYQPYKKRCIQFH